MAGRGKRVASRQAQLKKKRRKGKGKPQQFEAGPLEPSSSGSIETSAEATAHAAEAKSSKAEAMAGAAEVKTGGADARAETSPSLSRSIVRRPSRSAGGATATVRGRQGAQTEAAITYPHLGIELRHIGVLTVVLAAALAVLTILLR